MPLLGSGKEMGELLQIKCTYADCNKRFKTEMEMKSHKLSEPMHDYCKRCDVDCTSWDDITQHKVSIMSEFMHDRNRGSDESPMHITCEFCGDDFKSFGGRKKHRSQNHQGEQSLLCPAKGEGCSGLFTRASHLICHLEYGHCDYITASKFKASVQQKHVLSEIWKNPDIFFANLQINKAFAVRNNKPGQITDGSEMQDQEEGGVGLPSIIDQDDEMQKGGYKPLQAKKNISDVKFPLTRSNLETWPRLPGQAPSRLTEDALRSLSIGSKTASITSTDGDYGSDITSRRGGQKIYTESYPSLSSPAFSASVNEDDDSDSDATTTPATPKFKPTAWSTGQTSKALFKDVTPVPAPGDYAAILKRREEELLADNGNSICYTRFYDPNSSDYNPDLFLHSVLQRYCCPFPECEAAYDTPSDIAEHLQNTHCRIDYNCTTCKKRFQSATALTAHMESAGRCRVKDSKNFQKLLDEITGGFLTAKRLDEPKVYATETAVVKAGKPANGVMSVQFKAKMPDDR